MERSTANHRIARASTGWPLRPFPRMLAIVVTAGLLLTPGTASAATHPHERRVSVIVQAAPGAARGIERDVVALGGTIGARLRIIHGFSASMSRSAIAALRTTPGVLSVTRNAHLAAESDSYDPSADVNSMASTADYLGADDWWNAGYTGAGIDVAVIDSGVSPVQGLDGAEKVYYGPDLSLESQSPSFANLDSFGHGTFMAGLIAANDPPLDPSGAPTTGSSYTGMAPDARIISIKVATADGGTDVSQVIAAIGWVVQHAHDPGFNMRVINLSYGTDSTQSYRYDPLAYAAEQAWRHGIVVVAAAGNRGLTSATGGLTDPAIDPFIIAVGSSDSMGTASQVDDTLSPFSSVGRYYWSRGPDFLAPGAHLQGLRVPNSYIDVNHPAAAFEDRFFRGSGTSQSAAITSGAVALIMQKYPSITPDQVKALLKGSASYLSAVASGRKMGSGEMQLSTALSRSLSTTPQNYTFSSGTGTLELARGTDHLSRDGVILAGEQDIMGSPFDATTMASLQAQGKSWSGGVWNGKSWSGDAWLGKSWSGVSWSGNSWSGVSWSDATWSGNSWSGKSWSNADWSGNSWSGISWSGQDWADGCWC